MDYQNGKVYTIRSPNTEQIYIGTTTQSLSRRFSFHKYHATDKCKTRKVTAHKIFDLGDAYIELLELYPCNTKEELAKREGELIREHKAICVNKFMPNQTQYEYSQLPETKIKRNLKQNERRRLKKQSNLVDTEKK